MARLMRLPLPQIEDTKRSADAAREKMYRQNSLVIGRIIQDLAAPRLGNMLADASIDE